MLAPGRTAGVFQFESRARHRHAAQHALRPLRRPRRHQRAAAPGPARRRHAPGVHPAQARRGAGDATRSPSSTRGPRADLRRHHLPGTGDAHRATCSPASRSPKPTCCARRWARRTPELIDAGARQVRRARRVARGHPAKLHRGARRPDRDLRPLRLQQVALGRVLDPLLPDRVAQDALSGRVHGGAALAREIGDTDKVVQVHQRGARARHRGAAARRERIGLQVHGRGRQARSASGSAPSATSGARRDRVDHRGARRRRPVRLALRLRRAGRPPALQQARVRGADRGGRAATRSAVTARSCSPRSTRRCRRRSCCQAGDGRGPGLALRRATRRRARRARAARCPMCTPWTEAERLAKEKEILGFFISRPSARALPHRGRAVRHPHHRHARPVERATGGARARSSPRIKRQISQEDRHGVRADRRSRISTARPRRSSSPRPGRSSTSRSARRGDAAQGRLLAARPGRGAADVHHRGRSRPCGTGGHRARWRWRSSCRRRRGAGAGP